MAFEHVRSKAAYPLSYLKLRNRRQAHYLYVDGRDNRQNKRPEKHVPGLANFINRYYIKVSNST